MTGANHYAMSMLMGIRAAVFSFATMSSGAADGQTPAAPTPAQKLQGVTIESSADAEKRESVASMIVVTRAEIVKYGDTSLLGVLARIPGISVGGGINQAGEVGLRGLGAGHTLIQVNGESAAAGFSLDSLSPELVERIEILKSGRADSSAQAIAGTINIVLRRIPSTAQQELKANFRDGGGKQSAGLAGQWSDKADRGNYALTASADVANTARQWQDSLRATGLTGLIFDRENRVSELSEVATFAVVPRANFTLDADTTLSFDGLFQYQKRDYHANEARSVFSGTPPLLPANVLNLALDSINARVTAGLKTGARDNGILEGKFSVTALERSGEAILDGFDVARTRVLLRTVTTESRERAVSTSGTYSHSLIGAHTLTAGWNGQYTRRTESRIQRDQVFDSRVADNRDEGYTAQVGNLAVFAQDEWEVSPATSVYFGVRWEGLTTDTADTVAAIRVSNKSSVFSPSAQLSFKLPDSADDRVKLALGRTYKAPTAIELIPRRWTVLDNTATTPNFQGNPALIPELAWGFDASYEKYLAHKQSLSLSLYVKRIENVIVPFTFQGIDGVWVRIPQNSGVAELAGLEADGKFRLASLMAAAPEVELRPSFNVNRSRLRSVPGPNSRLNLHPKYAVGLGADYRANAIPVSFGADFKFEKIGLTTDALFQTRGLNDRRTLDAYAVWNVQKGVRLKLSGLNLLAQDIVEPITYRTASFLQRQVQTMSVYRTIRLEGAVQW